MLAVDIMPFIWALIIILSVAHEALTSALVAIWLVPASVLALGFTLCGFDVWICGAVFAASFALMFLLSRTIFKGNLRQADSPLGCEGIVLCELNDRNNGIVLVLGKEWRAIAKGSRSIPCGSIVKIMSLDDQILICKMK